MLDTLSHFILFFCLLRKIILALWLFYIFHSCSLPHYQSCMCPFTSVPPTPRPEKDGSATRVDAVCTYHSESPSTRLDREQLYRELSQETHGITWLYSFTLDRNSLYVNGEWKRYHQSFIAHILDLPSSAAWGGFELVPHWHTPLVAFLRKRHPFTAFPETY